MKTQQQKHNHRNRLRRIERRTTELMTWRVMEITRAAQTNRDPNLSEIDLHLRRLALRKAELANP